MNSAKIRLSPEERELVENAAMILTKNAILEKADAFLGLLCDRMIASGKLQKLPSAEAWLPPKISRGEHYEGLPYRVLDFPRQFSQEHIFAIRILFWWGNYFSITLHLKGKFNAAYLPVLQKNSALLRQEQLLLNTSPDPWQHRVDRQGYQQLPAKPEAWGIAAGQSEFLKMVKTFPLGDFQSAEAGLFRCWEILMDCLITETV